MEDKNNIIEEIPQTGVSIWIYLIVAIGVVLAILLIRKFIVKENENELELTKEEVEFVCKCVKTHMGPWTTDYKGNEILNSPKDKYQRFVHMCDYLSSKKFINVEFDGINIKE